MLLFLLLSIPATRVYAVEPRVYLPDWKDLDSRLLPQWYDEAKISIFVHWGVYSVPAILSEWFWYEWITRNNTYVEDYMKKNYPPGFTYQEFAPMFKAQLFDPDKWAELFAKAGAKFVVLTSKHHDGYTLFPSKYSPNWNSVEIGPKRDIVGDLKQSVLKQGMKFGLYYSLLEWNNPLFLYDIAHIRNKSQYYVHQKMLPELKQLINDYEPSVLWADGDWVAPDFYWSSQEILAWLYNESPVKDEVVVNDRWGYGKRGVHGGFYNYDDKFNNRTLMGHKWENAFTLDIHSWGYRIDAELRDFLTVPYIIVQIVTTVSCGGFRSQMTKKRNPYRLAPAIQVIILSAEPAGTYKPNANPIHGKTRQSNNTIVNMLIGNILINVGPTKEGTIAPIFQDRLLSLGQWLSANGDAIYQTSPWEYQNDVYNRGVWYTCNKSKYNAERPASVPSPDEVVTAVYAITLAWPKKNTLVLASPSSYLLKGDCRVELLGYRGGDLKWHIAKGMTYIKFPDKSLVKSEHAWAVKISRKP